MTVCLIGWSGLVGSLVLSRLLADSEIVQIVCLGRKPMQHSDPKIKYIQLELGDLNKIPSISASHFICCLGTTIKVAKSKEAFRFVDQVSVVEFGKLAERSKASSLQVISAIGADPNSSIFYNKVKGDMQEELRALKIGFIQVLQPSLLLGDRREFRLGESLAMLLSPILKMVMIGPLKKYKPTEAQEVADQVCKTIKQIPQSESRTAIFKIKQF